MPQYLTRNETVLPTSFINSKLLTLGSSAYTGLGNIDTNANYNLYIGGRESFSIKKDTSMAIVACGQDMKSSLFLQ